MDKRTIEMLFTMYCLCMNLNGYEAFESGVNLAQFIDYAAEAVGMTMDQFNADPAYLEWYDEECDAL
jgi:hypothetical protein